MEADQIIPIVSIVGGLSLGGLFWWLVIRAQVRAREMLHAERLAAIAKGLPPPDEPAEAGAGGPGVPVGSGEPPLQDKALGTGLFWLFLGVGAIVALRIVNPGGTSWGWGVIPVSLGLAYLAGIALSNWLPVRARKDHDSPQDNRQA
jgi:hypothetical protein